MHGAKSRVKNINLPYAGAYVSNSLLRRVKQTLILAALASTAVLPVSAAEIGPHDLTIAYTPIVQRAVRSSKTNANAELDIIGRFQLSAGGAGAWGETRLSFWAVGNHTLGGTLSTGAFSRNAGLLWDSNDGDAPEADGSLGVFTIQQDFQTANLSGTVELGKLYPGNNLVELDYAGDDRDSFMSQIISSDAVGRWYDRIGLGLTARIESNSWYAAGLISDATAQKRLFDFDTVGDGSNLVAVEFGLTPTIAGRASKFALMPYRIGKSTDFTSEKGLVMAFSHDLVGATGALEAPVTLFGRYTWRDGGEPLTADGRDEARPLRRGGFVGVAFNQPFGRENQQIAVSLMQGSASATAQANGSGSQNGIEGYWKLNIGQHAQFTTGLQVIHRGDAGLEYIPGLRLKIVF
jgi:hypothetical protein